MINHHVYGDASRLWCVGWNFSCFNKYFGYRRARPTNLDILTILYHDAFWVVHMFGLSNREPCCLIFLFFSLSYILEVFLKVQKQLLCVWRCILSLVC